MSAAEVKTFDIEGLALIPSLVFPDSRGYFMETYRRSTLEQLGIKDVFVQDNLSHSTHGVMRGLHFQRPPHAQSKLVRVVAGAVFDVAVDLRPASPTFGKWASVILRGGDGLAFFIPTGFAHGFLVLSDEAYLLYKCTTEYAPSCEGGIRWDDPDLGVAWPFVPTIVSPKDGALPLLQQVESILGET